MRYAIKYQTGAIAGDYGNRRDARRALRAARHAQSADDIQAIWIIELDEHGDEIGGVLS